MHPEARDWVAQHAPPGSCTTVEIGARDINGTIRDLFTGDYTGIDVVDGPGVDVVADAIAWQPPAPVDVVVCCEVLEHVAEWRSVLWAAIGWLRPGGRLIVTAAGPSRAPHSAVDGGPLRDGEHYAGIDPDDLARVLGQFGEAIVAERAAVGDVYAVLTTEALARC